MPKKVAVGIVTSDKMNKTRVVEIPRLVQHKKYGKYIRRKTICHVHDDNEESSVGDKVEIIEAPPRSKMKRWDLVRVIEKSRMIDVAALRAAQKKSAQGSQETQESEG